MMDFIVLLNIGICSLLIQRTDQCVQTNNGQYLPTFQDYYEVRTSRITRYHLAIIPSYRLTCCGKIRAWGVDVEPGIYYASFRQYTLNLQVWRPSPTVDDSTGTGCYSLVGNNRFQFSNDDLRDGTFRISPSPQDYIQFQPGDVLGFYVENANDGENGVVALTTDSYTRESVWYASATSQNVAGCPISVGSGGDLNTMLRGAPVISIATETSNCPQISPTPTPYSMTPSPTVTMTPEVPFATLTPEPQSEEPAITTPEPITDEPTKTEPITDEITIPTDEPLSRDLPTNDMPVTDDEATIDNSTKIQDGSASQPLLIGTVAAAVSVLLSLTILVSVIICKKRSKSFDITQQSTLQLGVTNRLQGIGDNSDTIEAELEQSEAYGVTGGQELATYIDESMYSYPVVDPDQSIEAKTNDAYAVSIVMKKNEAYIPVSTTSVRESACTDEYDYI